MNWSNAISDFTHYLKLERGLADNTIEAYKQDLIKLSNWCEAKELAPLLVSSGNLKEYVQQFSVDGFALSTQSRLISTLRAFFNYLEFEGYQPNNPAELLETPKTSRKLPDTLTEDDVNKIIAAIDLSFEHGERNRAMLEVLYGCGLRVSELINLKVNDLFFDQELIRVVGKGNKERVVPINTQAIKYVNIYKNEVRVFSNIQKGEEGVLFLNRRGKRLTRAMIFTLVRNYTEQAGIHKKVSPHTFRHSFASHMVNRGADIRIVQDLLGHASIVTTEIYTHLDQTKIRKAFTEFHPRGKN